ncbi:hypothetical protein [Lichenicoccus sp.]|uniref:hypothetical protein n=1 Tax=Lichenicoccus sp. TaxID=2781899 RepID=UPI003D09B062
MTPERFAALADAHGGMLERWPDDLREAARAHLLLHPEAAGILDAAARLDAALATWTVPGPGAALSGRILMQAASRHRHAGRLRLWFSGLGAAGVLAGGVAAGAAFVTLSQPGPDQVGDHLYEVSVLGAPLDPEEPATTEVQP